MTKKKPPVIRIARSCAMPALLALLALLAVSTLADAVPVKPSPVKPSPVKPSPVKKSPSKATAKKPGPVASFDPGTAGFSLQVKDEVIPYRVMGVFVLPGEDLRLEAVFGTRASRFEAKATAGILKPLDSDRWSWVAPKAPGLYKLTVKDAQNDDAIRLNIFVMHPYSGQEEFKGYRIGHYERLPLRNLPAYAMPKGFVQVTPKLTSTAVSPHFTLGQFVSKQKSDFPKFLVLRERMILKLERLLERFNEQGIATPTLTVMSAFRTPFYNASIGNRTVYSRHCYGDAADIFIDTDGDDRLDDLNGDGLSDLEDAKVMAAIVEGMTEATWYQPFVGGLGLYDTAPHRGPFIHVDTRGYPARW